MDTEQNEATAKRRFEAFSKALTELQETRREEARACGELDAELYGQLVVLVAAAEFYLADHSPAVRLEVMVAGTTAARRAQVERSAMQAVAP